ncbi:hypothetical protein J7L18_05850, partial [Candidatus Bathyarchaeota archaeon]|nr:hypothetical protein [Candidatus Bathyarchaeota archaeon]
RLRRSSPCLISRSSTRFQSTDTNTPQKITEKKTEKPNYSTKQFFTQMREAILAQRKLFDQQDLYDKKWTFLMVKNENESTRF